MQNVPARVSGYLQSTHFKEGVEVKEGDLLFVVDPRRYDAELVRKFSAARGCCAYGTTRAMVSMRSARL